MAQMNLSTEKNIMDLEKRLVAARVEKGVGGAGGGWRGRGRCRGFSPGTAGSP